MSNKYGFDEGQGVIGITQEAYDSIIAQAKTDAPVESCGYALGTEGPDGKIVITHNFPVENIDHAEEHFTMDPKGQFAAIRFARQNGLKVIGNWHSHPASPSRPSEEDKRLAVDPSTLYLIVSLAPEESGLPYVSDPDAPVINAFRIATGKVERFPVLV